MKQHRVDGCIMYLSGKNTSNYEHFEMLQQARIPVVFFDRIPNLPNMHAVSCNLESGTVQAVDFLLKQGHRVIGMINGPETMVASKERATGYIRALQKHRLKYDPKMRSSTPTSPPQAQIKPCSTSCRSKRKVTAVVAFNDYVAMDAVQYALKQELEINKDITFGILRQYTGKRVYSLSPCCICGAVPYEQGRAATNMLLSLLNGEHA